MGQLRRLVMTHSQAAFNLQPRADRLTSLKHLDLSHNRMGAVPKTLGALVLLQHLDLSHNSE
ncbi:leucine-rich repeat (LRR) protein [Haematococcus lacustris]|uniref:Leucine-rich repeat (LRR) protein n=1 Tax=Haematococcus lacustris TaxID=44745 RepID=A0A699Z0X1_HAELA|nr:leucine-rich repeat (LRR) protein [Haematococcus lacustris]